MTAAVVPVVLFVLFAVPPLDERFLLTILPAAPLVVGVTLRSGLAGRMSSGGQR